MKLNRRNLIKRVGAFAAAAQIGTLTGLSSAKAAGDVDQKELLVAPEMGDMVLGKADAPVTIVEYASATCPHCAGFHNGTFKTLKSEFIDTGKVRFIFREMPFDDLALAAFMLARCAPKDKYFGMLDVIFEKQREWIKNPREELLKIAKLAGFTAESFDKCLSNQEIAKGVQSIGRDGNKKFGVNATPSFFVNGKFFSGNASIDKFKEMIEAAN